MPSGEEHEVTIDIDGRPALAIAMTVDPQRIADIDHNRWRYDQLQRLRAGQPNQYQQTRYR